MNIFKYQLEKDRKYAGQGLGSFVNNLGIPLLKLHQEEEKRIIKTMKENIIEIMHIKHIKNTKKKWVSASSTGKVSDS